MATVYKWIFDHSTEGLRIFGAPTRCRGRMHAIPTGRQRKRSIEGFFKQPFGRLSVKSKAGILWVQAGHAQQFGTVPTY